MSHKACDKIVSWPANVKRQEKEEKKMQTSI